MRYRLLNEIDGEMSAEIFSGSIAATHRFSQFSRRSSGDTIRNCRGVRAGGVPGHQTGFQR